MTDEEFKNKFNEILDDIREDFSQIKEMFIRISDTLSPPIFSMPVVDEEFKIWVYDTFLDKVYETNSKIKNVLKDLNISTTIPDANVEEIQDSINNFFTNWSVYKDANDVIWAISQATIMKNIFDTYIISIESLFSSIRKHLYDGKWERLKNISPTKYFIQKRKRFVKAGEELERAERAIKDEDWPEVLNHLRVAIDLAIKEKFGFKKIHPMINFIQDAEKLNLPLPSYNMIYSYFNEGSKRLHTGYIHTPFEAIQSLKVVKNFIDRLKLIDVDEKTIQKFKQKCKFVN